MPKFKEFLFGKKDKTKQVSRLTPMQEELMALITDGIKSGKGPFADIFGSFDEKAFNQGVKDPALKDFKETLLPMLQEKYIANNQVGGSGMMNDQVKAASSLQSQLAQLMYQAQQQQKQNRASGLNTVLGTQQFDTVTKQGTQGVVPSILQGALPGLASIATNKVNSWTNSSGAASTPPVTVG